MADASGYAKAQPPASPLASLTTPFQQQGGQGWPLLAKTGGWWCHH
ncbi:MAG: hypothetical protein H6668_16360 [Ardenticatenaceae bacterium]|nr:hypothetical protein [Ardenticatenaceae bacterium]